jgi:two-component system OmpR family sensor kinase
VIRRRLTFLVVLLVAVVGTVAAVGVVRTVEARLMADIDRQLGSVPPSVTRRAATVLERRLDPAVFDVRQVALVRLGRNGAVLSSVSSGPVDDPDPLPQTAGLDAPAGPVTIGSVDEGGPRFRAVTSSLPGGGSLVTAISLADVDAVRADVRQSLVVAGLAALAAVAVAGWLVIRLGLRPLDHMVTTAQRVAEGHVTERVAAGPANNEVGRLGAALDLMLDRIGEALAARTASEARMRRFVADASHELRTPLTAVRGYAELYGRSNDPGERALAMERVGQAAARMGGLVDDLVLLARLDQGRPLASEPVDLAQLVEEVAADARAVDPDRPVALDVHPGGAVVVGDRARLRQVLDNLMANVAEHTPAGTPVRLGVEPRGATVSLTVTDEGPGMARDEAVRAFDRFWQGGATVERPREGTGLGLSIVADLVRAHGGEVGLDTAPGWGMRVTITLPRADSQAPSRPA